MAAIAGGAGTGGGDDPNELTQHPGTDEGVGPAIEMESMEITSTTTTSSSDDTIDEQPMNKTEKPVPEKPSSWEEEKKIIKELEQRANEEGLKLGQTWYVVAVKWWKAWKESVSYDWQAPDEQRPPPPGPIDNTKILEPPIEEARIKKSCMENYDFVLLSEDQWRTLHAWYGGGPALPRKVIKSSGGWYSSNLTVEVRPLLLKVAKSSAPTEYVTVSVSKSETVGGFRDAMCKKFGLNKEDVRVWDYHGFTKYKLLEDLNQQLDAAQIIDNQPMLLEEKDENGKFPEIPKSRVYGSSGYYSSGPTDPGTTGLVNLGNTCFMNSSLQCLAHTNPLVDFFNTEQWKTDVNTDNPLGMKGELAEEYAKLVKELWSGTHSAIAPRDFKWKLERFAPQFAGYQQHDSQELLAFLLDGLHEDLNRIKKKPYNENPEVGDRPEAEVANEAWRNHKARNDSIIVDWFQGQLRSTLICPVCKRVSITFDPFMYLSLPLPMKTTRHVYVTLFFLDPAKKPMRFCCEVQKSGSIGDLQNELGKMSGLAPESIVICDVYNHKFFKRFISSEQLDAIQDRDYICGYEIIAPPKDTAAAADVAYFPVVLRKDEPAPSYSMSFVRKSLFGIPFIISVPNSSTVTYKQLYEIIYQHIARYLKVPADRVIRTVDELYAADAGGAADDEEIKESSSEDEPEAAGHGKDMEEDERKTDSDSDSDDHSPPPKVKKVRKPLPLFTISCVDAYGTTDQEPILRDDDKPLGLEDRQTLAVCFLDEVLESIFIEEALKDIENHESCLKPQEDKEREETISLQQCIELFTTVEKLGPDDPWYCSNCKEHQQATKKFDLWKLPPILVVHLKRFSYKNRYWREKLETFVDYPLTGLDLTAYVKGPDGSNCVYDLYAVSNHYGSLGGGHYTAYAKNKNDGKWYTFDDSSVSQASESKVRTSSAYVLFYQRRDTISTAPSATASSTASTSTNAATQNSSTTDDVTMTENGKAEEDLEDTQEMEISNTTDHV